MISQFQNEDETLQIFINNSKNVFGNNLKAIVLFGSRAGGMARKHSDYDLLIVAEKLPSDWRKRDNLVMELDQHGISDILLYTEKEMEDAINSVNPIMMNIFDHPIKTLHGKSCIDRLSNLYSKNISGNILKIGRNTWKITGEINA